MKKILLLSLVLMFFSALQAQIVMAGNYWVSAELGENPCPFKMTAKNESGLHLCLINNNQDEKKEMIYRNFGNNVNEYYVQRFKNNFADHAARIAKIKTKTAAEQYVAEIRKQILKIFAFPKRTPLQPVVTNKKRFPGYTLETLYYYSRPNYPVTANFFLPEKFSGKLPGILFVCGHSNLGKSDSDYITCAITLALKGFAVLVIDPVQQGERKQSLDGDLCDIHNILGKQQFLIGEWFGAWLTWDGIRGLDYLESRPEVDSSRLGVTGNSGGGTLTTWIAATDPRPIAVAPGCYITSWKHNVENELPADIEQMPPNAIKYGLEMADFLLATAPRDILILGQELDFFDVRGTRETYAGVKKVNSLLGGETELFIGPTFHGYHIENRCAMYRFFTEKMLGKANGTEPKITLPKEEETYAVKGSVLNIPGQKSLNELTIRKLEELEVARKPLSLEETRKMLMQFLNIKKIEVPHYRILRCISVDKTDFFPRIGIETEGTQIMSVMHYAHGDFYDVDHRVKKGIIYIPDRDSIQELIPRRKEKDTAIYGLDIRGFGEMMPTGCGQSLNRDFLAEYEFDYHYAALGQMCGNTIFAGRIKDILGAIEILSANGYTEIILEGNGLGAIPALFAAVLSDKVTKVKLNQCIESYSQFIRGEVKTLPLSCMLPNILKYTDLGELRNLIKDKLF